MNEIISNKIEEIKSKFADLKQSLEKEKSENGNLLKVKEELETEIKNLEEGLSFSKNELSELRNSNEDLKKTKEELENQLNSKAELVEPNQLSTRNNDVEIDFIVREIDQCIRQIKNNL
ncbi:MAG: hypothetical protein V4622_06585 [Bacteroidota bacterium]